jgi:hypothetical protein
MVQQKRSYDMPGLINDRPHLTLICGRKGSGKSHLLVKLLKTAWCGIYDEIIICSPTFQSQFTSLWSQLSPEGITVYNNLDAAFVEKLMADQSSSTTNSLLILDDCGEDLRKVAPGVINKLVSNSRHYKLSIIALHQKLTQAPSIVRANADCFISFAACSFLEREALWKEVSTIPRKEFQQAYNLATQSKHGFLVSTIDKGGALKLYHDDFKTLVL